MHATHILMPLSLEHNVSNFPAYGDSKLVVSWMEGKIPSRDTSLKSVINREKKLVQAFHSIKFSHIYRKKNLEIDK
jgi:hypothetical protein